MKSGTAPYARRPPLDEGHSLAQSSYHYTQSSHLPKSLFQFLCLIFGVKSSPNDRKILSRCLFAFTVLMSLCCGVMDGVYNAYSVKSKNTKQTVTTGVFSMLITVIWCALAIYAHRLCSRSLTSVSFVNSLRLHSKTVFKIPAAILVSLMALAAVAVGHYQTYKMFWMEDTCAAVDLDVWACKSLFLLRVVLSVLVLFYNLLVATSVLSICRTHTIGVRRFIRALENDGIACETKHRQRFLKMKFAASHNLAELYLPEQCYGDDLAEDDNELYPTDSNDQQNLISYTPTSISGPESGANNNATSQPQRHSTNTHADDSRLAATHPDPRILSKDDILFSYWKLASRMRMSSRALQRWLASWILFTILWLFKWILQWIDHPSTYFEITQFILPLLMLIIICSAYGEVNGECSIIVSSITPLQDRLDLIKTLPNIQTGMGLFNYPIRYADIITIIAGLGLALCSRIILDEFLPPSPHS